MSTLFRLVVSMKSGDVYVKIRAFPSKHSDLVALLVPADTHLTLRESCDLNRLTGPETTFRFVPPGKYRILVIDAKLKLPLIAIS